MMQRVLLAAVLVLLVMCGIAAAEPKHVDGGWQRSDEVSQETPPAPPPQEMPAPTAAPPETATEPKAPKASSGGWGYYAMAGVGGLFALTVLWCWLRRDA